MYMAIAMVVLIVKKQQWIVLTMAFGIVINVRNPIGVLLVAV